MRRLRLRLLIEGMVQGVGFRPFVARLASSLALAGSIKNTPAGVCLEVEGGEGELARFRELLVSDRPAAAFYWSISEEKIDPAGDAGFEIVGSSSEGKRSGWVLPDQATCPKCLEECRDVADRRYLYPFISCTDCGPRYSILETLPYDRERTTMSDFPLCEDCLEEYRDPEERRFHAETTACPACGPKVRLEVGDRVITAGSAIDEAAGLILGGVSVALLGLGGFLLVCDATNPAAVMALRDLKRRDARPFAVMFPSPVGDPLAVLERYADTCGIPPRIFTGDVRPIVILPARRGTDLAGEVSMGLPWVGAYLPTTALHQILLDKVGRPVVSTSGNLSGEPIITGPEQGRSKLGGSGGLLVHDRRILRGVDDSVVRFAGGRAVAIRRARGMAPKPVRSPFEVGPSLAVGANQKACIAIGMGRNIFIGPHIGDMDNPKACAAFREQASELPALAGVEPEWLACDMHPRYHTSIWCEAQGKPVVKVQHHHAHIAAVMGENGVGREEKVLGLSWDGTGWGPDGRAWGGELLLCGYSGYERLAAPLPFPLLGGEKAVEEPRRVALALALGALGEGAARHPMLGGLFTDLELENLIKLWGKGISVESTSVGRIFDAFSCLILRHPANRYEGEAAMRLEASATGHLELFPPAQLIENRDQKPGEPLWWIDWRPWVPFAMDRCGDLSEGDMAGAFHLAVAGAGLMAVEMARGAFGTLPLAISGGCFQNCRLVELFFEKEPATLAAVDLPPNDGGLSYGQLLVGASRFAGG